MALVLDELLEEAPVTWFLSYKGAPLLPPMRLMELIMDFPQEMPAERQRKRRLGKPEKKSTAWQSPAMLLVVTLGTAFYAKTYRENQILYRKHRTPRPPIVSLQRWTPHNLLPHSAEKGISRTADPHLHPNH